MWVDGRPLPFGASADYPPPVRDAAQFWPTTTDIDEPAKIGAAGNVVVSKVKVFRDIYYTCWPNESGPQAGSRFQDCDTQTFYVQPGHYMCLGDNSASSADSRTWGVVPDRLMLGRAIWVYWPVTRFGKIE